MMEKIHQNFLVAIDFSSDEWSRFMSWTKAIAIYAGIPIGAGLLVGIAFYKFVRDYILFTTN